MASAWSQGGDMGAQFDGDLFMGGARNFLEGGHLFHFNLTGNRARIGVDDCRLEDRVADNTTSSTSPKARACSSGGTSGS